MPDMFAILFRDQHSREGVCKTARIASRLMPLILDSHSSRTKQEKQAMNMLVVLSGNNFDWIRIEMDVAQYLSVQLAELLSTIVVRAYSSVEREQYIQSTLREEKWKGSISNYFSALTFFAALVWPRGIGMNHQMPTILRKQ